jgi:hypothetical protein
MQQLTLRSKNLTLSTTEDPKFKGKKKAFTETKIVIYSMKSQPDSSK